MRIREDLGKVVYVAGVILRPGDEVPKGATVDVELCEEPKRQPTRSKTGD